MSGGKQGFDLVPSGLWSSFFWRLVRVRARARDKKPDADTDRARVRVRASARASATRVMEYQTAQRCENYMMMKSV